MEKDVLSVFRERPYEFEYFEQCKHIWSAHVPDEGRSDCLQGELLRAVEKLRHEAQCNGNCNWDEAFEYFCTFISTRLCAFDIFDEKEKSYIKAITRLFADCGKYASLCLDESLTDEQLEKLTGKPFNVDNLAYTEDNLYDFLADMTGKLQKHHPEPMPYEHDMEIWR